MDDAAQSRLPPGIVRLQGDYNPIFVRGLLT